MALLDLPTREDYAALAAKLDRVLSLLAQPAAPATEQLVTLEQVASHTKFDPRTVRDWVQSGRFDDTGHRVYLPAYEFRNGQLRFKLSAVEAFGLKVGVLKPSPVAGAPAVATKAAKPAQPKKKGAPVASSDALKVA